MEVKLVKQKIEDETLLCKGEGGLSNCKQYKRGKTMEVRRGTINDNRSRKMDAGDHFPCEGFCLLPYILCFIVLFVPFFQNLMAK